MEGPTPICPIEMLVFVEYTPGSRRGVHLEQGLSQLSDSGVVDNAVFKRRCSCVCSRDLIHGEHVGSIGKLPLKAALSTTRGLTFRPGFQSDRVSTSVGRIHIADVSTVLEV